MSNRTDLFIHTLAWLSNPPKQGLPSTIKNSPRVSWPAVIRWAGLLLKMSLWIQLQLRKVNRSVQPHITSLKLTVTWARRLCQALCLWLLSYDWQSGGTFRNCRYYNFPKGMHGQSKKCNTMVSKVHITCMGLNARIRHFPLKCILECLISLFPV